MEQVTYYFTKPGSVNTDETLRLAKKRASELGIKKVVVASTTGATGVKAVNAFRGYEVIVVTHSTGFSASNVQEINKANQKKIIEAGGKILTTTHALGGVGRAVRKKLNTYQTEEIIAYALRIFCEGIKVGCEISMMAADAGLVRTDEEIIAIGGTGSGADTAMVLKPAHAQNFFDMEVLEVICKPRGRADRKG